MGWDNNVLTTAKIGERALEGGSRKSELVIGGTEIPSLVLWTSPKLSEPQSLFAWGHCEYIS